MHKTAAWPLALLYGVLIGYASLYPFSGWRDAGVAPWDFFFIPPVRYWSGFDVAINVIGYMPFGSLLALGVLRSTGKRHSVLVPVLCAAVLSLSMETLQNYLPTRVASKEDWLLNVLGVWLGAVTTQMLELLGAIQRWSRVRARWFEEPARGGIVLLAMWPLALVFPAAVPFGLGQVMERSLTALAQWLQDSPFLEWLPTQGISLEPLVPAAELVCVLLGLLIPCLLGFCIIRALWRRVVFTCVMLAIGVAVTGLSSALSWGPEHAWAWLNLPAQWGLALAFVFALGLAMAPWRASAALAVLALGVYLSLLNQTPADPYLAQTLQTWEQGRFIRFHGLAQWLGWSWPYAALVYVLSRIWVRDTKN